MRSKKKQREGDRRERERKREGWKSECAGREEK
jgi:hypothetical protein